MRRFWMRVAIAAAMVGVVASCGYSPPQHGERERRAAGLEEFKLVIVRELWTRTKPENSAAKVEPKGDDPATVVTVTFTGPQLVDYLQDLDYETHAPNWMKGDGGDTRYQAARVYDTLAAYLDKWSKPPPSNAPTPMVTVDARGVVTPTAIPTTSRSK